MESHEPKAGVRPPSLIPPVEVPTLPLGSGIEEPSEPVPGTLQIDIAGGTATPVLSPIPDPATALVVTNSSGGQMGVTSTTAAGTVAVVVPDGGTVGIVPTVPMTSPDMTISVLMRVRIEIPNPFPPPSKYKSWAHIRQVLKSSDRGDALPANQRHSVGLDGSFTRLD